MSWAGDALAALRKIITLEERVTTLSDDIHELTRMLRDLDHRLVKMETKFEVYERLSDKPRSRRLPPQN
ncbi:hypothetical protein [Nitrospira moscoviensis]|jgi:SMC interacting uncharacterized protein involved in chromosome segregation|uniref:Uncharacterized protein n=1 Tax=Nitrospira moscoviensis TaxID=42253 RepID=A0A0K2GBK6_NITMO|nr:hypothetical protein [Nitrospira moscoviensis]ALA58351.1 hypothetical protein NITMOv2_1932 [Nitrospira moscoviensis]